MINAGSRVYCMMVNGWTMAWSLFGGHLKCQSMYVLLWSRSGMMNMTDGIITLRPNNSGVWADYLHRVLQWNVKYLQPPSCEPLKHYLEISIILCSSLTYTCLLMSYNLLNYALYILFVLSNILPHQWKMVFPLS